MQEILFETCELYREHIFAPHLPKISQASDPQSFSSGSIGTLSGVKSSSRRFFDVLTSHLHALFEYRRWK